MEDFKDTCIVLVITFLVVLGTQAAMYVASHLMFRMLFQARKFNLKRNVNKSGWKNASKAFGIKVGKLKKMSKEEIKKLYRKKVLKAHPDQGGNQEDFINLHAAYKFAYAA